MNETFARVMTLTGSQRPTRVLLICPTPSPEILAHRTFLEIANIPIGLPLLMSEKASANHFLAAESFSVILAINRESMLIDPIDWFELKSALLDWAEKRCPTLKIPVTTDNLFRERTFPSHKPRVIGNPSLLSKSGVFNFFDPELRPPQNGINYLISCGIPVQYAKVINKVNNHNRSLSMIGILPNQLRTMLKQTNVDSDTAFEAISKELFWQGYTLWKIRKRMMSSFWKNIAPEHWKLHGNRKRERKRHDHTIAEKCTSPFHFLIKHSDISHKRPTPCPCSRIINKSVIHKFLDLRDYVTRARARIDNMMEVNDSVYQKPQKPRLYLTREDLIRGAHDLDKKSDF